MGEEGRKYNKEAHQHEDGGGLFSHAVTPGGSHVAKSPSARSTVAGISGSVVCAKFDGLRSPAWRWRALSKELAFSSVVSKSLGPTD